MTWIFMRKRGRGFDARNRNPWLPGGCTQAQIAPWDKYIVVSLLQSEESHSIHDTWQGSAAPDTSWSFFPAPSICFIPFSSSALWDLFSSSFFFTFSTYSAPLGPGATLSFVPEVQWWSWTLIMDTIFFILVRIPVRSSGWRWNQRGLR